MATVFPAPVQQRLIFSLLVLFSFYLALSALLAIAVFQDKSRPQQLTLAAFEKSLEPNIIAQEVFDKAYPQELAVPREAQKPVVLGSHTAYALRTFDIEYQSRASSSGALQNDWAGLRQKALADQTRLRDQAKYAFSAGSEASAGKRQTAQHFNELLSWHQQSMQLIRDGMDRCRTVITTFTTTATQSLETLRAELEKSTPENVTDKANEFINANRRPLLQTFNDARRGCQRTADDRRPAIPERRSLASGLGLIGDWTGWLVNPEQLPVVIIVGLVGFSLLGATVSRVVRAQQESQTAGLTFDDLLTVITGGTTAALVVFLGAYGGLALLGTTSGDPNPYVVFITCLIGAVYSEDVWSWARKRILSDNLERSGGKPPAERPKVRPPRTQ
jgi:hypothetical protein